MSLDRIPQNGLVEELRVRLREEDELKGSFQSVGSASIRTHRLFSSAPYDAELIASPVPGTVIVHRVDVEFLPADLTFGGAFCHRIQADVMDLNNNRLTHIDPMPERRYTNDGRQITSFYHVSFGNPSDSIRMKFYLSTTGLAQS